MSALSIQVPFPVFNDRDGQPLDNGYVWIGVPNLPPQTNPVNVYFDEALTILAPQPLRTINGYISRAGSPAQVYIDGVNFSILVQDSKGSMVYNFENGTGISPNAAGVSFTGFKGQSGNLQDLADNDGSDWIGFEPAGSGAVARSAQDKMRETISSYDYQTNANATAAAVAALPTGFWPDVGGADILRLGQRIFVGDAVAFSGDWYGTDNPFGYLRWTLRETQQVVINTVGRQSIAGLTKTSLGQTTPGGTPTTSDAAIGIIGVGVADYVGPDNRNAWGGYFESWKGAGSTHAAFGVEIDVGNDSAVNSVNFPNLPFGAQTFGLAVAAGGAKTGGYANPSSCAIVIANNTQTFNKGIVFGSTAITGSNGTTGFGIAIAFSKGHSLTWFNNSNSQTSLIYSTVEDVNKRVGIQFLDNIIRLTGAGTVISEFIDTANAVNGFRLSNSQTGSPVVISTSGPDANIDIRLQPKGTGRVSFGLRTATADAPITGYIEIKDAGGTLRRLAVIS